jgi:Alginate export
VSAPRLAFVVGRALAAALISVAIAAPPADADCPSGAPRYLTLRYEEDYSFLRDATCRTDLWDPIKLVPIDPDGSTYLSMGGDARVKYEYFHNALWGQGVQDSNGYVLQRYLLHGDFHAGPHFRLFAQFQSSLEEGRSGGPRLTDKNTLEVNQGFMDLIAPLWEDAALTLRVGRQELAYGSQRLVSVRESPNVRQTFDAVRLIFAGGGWRIDGFFSSPVQVRPGIFDDRRDDQRSFWGVYGTGPAAPLPAGRLDLYYLGLRNDNARFDQGTAEERRHTLGARFWGRPYGWDYNVELIFQWGSFGRGDLLAWGAASDTSYTFRSVPLRPRVGIRADINSGDRDPGDRDLHTFNALFPKGSYFGEIALLGPANLFDVHPYVILNPIDSVSITFEADIFRRQSDRDGIYSPPGGLLRSGGSSRARHIGEQVSIQVEWRIDAHLSIVANYTHFFAGRFIRDTGPSEDIDYTTAWVQYKF